MSLPADLTLSYRQSHQWQYSLPHRPPFCLWAGPLIISSSALCRPVAPPLLSPASPRSRGTSVAFSEGFLVPWLIHQHSVSVLPSEDRALLKVTGPFTACLSTSVTLGLLDALNPIL